jgi:hypothetical protein
MSKLSIAKRLSKKVRTGVFHFAGRDPVTHERLTRRADLRRIGTRYGGWSIPSELLNAGSICYCVGCGEDITFDLGLIEQFQCEVFAYDPTPRAVEHVKAHAGDVARYHFSAVGLWDKTERLKFYAPSNPTHVSHSLLNLQNTRDYIEVPVERLSAIMARNQHSHIAILCVEFDEYWNPLDKDYLQRIGSYVRKILARGYLMIDAPGNANYTFMKPAAV